MKKKVDLVRGWLKKAWSDGIAMDASIKAGALDAACFHAQQMSEKYLKAFLVHADVDFPYTHNLAKLVGFCTSVDESFSSLIPIVTPMTPYAVEVRYDNDFWPDTETANEAKTSALFTKDFVLSKLPEEIVQAI